MSMTESDLYQAVLDDAVAEIRSVVRDSREARDYLCEIRNDIFRMAEALERLSPPPPAIIPEILRRR